VNRLRASSMHTLLFVVFLIMQSEQALAVRYVEDDIVFIATPKKKTAIFAKDEKIVYKVDVKNNLGATQEGTIGYAIMDLKDKVLNKGTIDVKLTKGASNNYTLNMPSQGTGFYRLHIIINVTEYDDTLKRVFGVNPEDIRSNAPRPADFDKFWQNGLDSLAKIPLRTTITLQPNLERDGLNCYLVEIQSWGNVTVRGWLTMSKNIKPGKKLPVWLVVPGYGGTGVKPVYADGGLAVFAFNIRGHGNSKDIINPSREGYLTTGIQNKYKYILRGAILDVIRAVDFITSRPELDENNIICSGGSMGAYLTIAVSSLDKRIKICSANNPVFSDYRSLVGSGDWPMETIQKYSSQMRIPLATILDNLDYYDLKNFAYNLECESLIAISLLDPLAPPATEYAMLNNIKNRKIYKLFIYPNLAHEVPPPLFKYLIQWTMDQFGMF